MIFTALGCRFALRKKNSSNLESFVAQVPSAYFLTDVFLRLDAQLGKKVFVPTKEMSRMSLSAVEGVKAKKLMGSLRALWRSSKDKGLTEKITHLKSFLQPSPARNRGEQVDQESSGEDEPQDDPVVAEEVENEGNQESSGDDDDASSGTSSVLKAPTLRLGELSQSDHEGNAEDEHEDGEPASKTQSDSESDGSSSPAPSWSPEQPVFHDGYEAGDSQVPGSGWMGRAMMNHRAAFGKDDGNDKKGDAKNVGVKEVNRKDEKMSRDAYINNYVRLVQEELKKQLGPSAEDGEMWKLYADCCRISFYENGGGLFDQLASADCYKEWTSKMQKKALRGKTYIAFCVTYGYFDFQYKLMLSAFSFHRFCLSCSIRAQSKHLCILYRAQVDAQKPKDYWQARSKSFEVIQTGLQTIL